MFELLMEVVNSYGVFSTTSVMSVLSVLIAVKNADKITALSADKMTVRWINVALKGNSFLVMTVLTADKMNVKTADKMNVKTADKMNVKTADKMSVRWINVVLKGNSFLVMSVLSAAVRFVQISPTL